MLQEKILFFLQHSFLKLILQKAKLTQRMASKYRSVRIRETKDAATMLNHLPKFI